MIEPSVVEQSLLDPFRIVPRPELPQEKQKRSCPKCRTESVFRPFDLFYRDSSEDVEGL